MVKSKILYPNNSCMKVTLSLCCLILIFFNRCGNAQKSEEKTVSIADAQLSRRLVMDSEKVRQGSSQWFSILDSAIKLDPYNASALREKSVWFTKTGDYEKAFDLLNAAVSLDSLDALGYRGWIKLYKIHDYTGAISDLEGFNSLSEGTSSAWGENVLFLTGLAKKQLGDFDSAISDFTQYINETTEVSGENWVDVYTFTYRGVCLRKLGEYSKALDNFNTTLKYYPQSPEAHWQKALTFEKMTLINKACQQIDSTLKYINYVKTDPYKELFDEPNLRMVQDKQNELCLSAP